MLAVYSWLHDDSVALGARQLEIFETLEETSLGAARRIHRGDRLGEPEGGGIQVIAALESAATFATEDEPLESALARLEGILERYGPILYLSLTWNEENRFGGGNASSIGLKPDGRTLLEFLSGRGVAIDFSHTSDALADGILEQIDRAGLDLSVLATHSNFRAVQDAARNLPDRIAKEIIHRGGVIGSNFLAGFVGAEPARLIDHIEHGLSLGGERSLALGADFFGTIDLPTASAGTPRFFDELPNSSAYPWLFERLAGRIPAEVRAGIWSHNAASFIERLWSDHTGGPAMTTSTESTTTSSG